MAKREFNNNAEIVFSCSEEFHYKGEMIMEEHCLVRVMSGELKVIQSDKTYVFGAGDTHLFPRNRFATLIKYEKEGRPYQAIVVKLTGAFLRDYYAKKSIEQISPRLQVQQVLQLSKSPLLDSFFNSLLPYFGLNFKLPEEIAELKLTEAVSILRNIHKDTDRILLDFSQPGKINLKEFMERNYMFNIPLEKFSFLTGRSLTSFKRDFKQIYQSTPQKWLTQKRLELAHYQLSQKHRKPIDVYVETGFENLSHFSYAFKQQYGYAPTELANKKNT